jgi:hypothetical protein
LALSTELQLGKAAEHFVCYDLIYKGYNAFLSDQGLPYDILIDHQSKIYKVQVKSTLRMVTYGTRKDVYSFGLVNGRKNNKTLRFSTVDIMAFFVFDLQKVAYIWMSQLLNWEGNVLTGVQFRDRNMIYNQQTKKNTRYFQDFLELKIENI